MFQRLAIIIWLEIMYHTWLEREDKEHTRLRRTLFGQKYCVAIDEALRLDRWLNRE